MPSIIHLCLWGITPRWSLWRGVLLFALCWGTLQNTAQAQPAEVAPLFLMGNQIHLEAKVNGSHSLRLQLDTGSPTSVLTWETAKRLGLKTTPLPNASWPNTHQATLDLLYIGPIRFLDVPVYVTDFPGLNSVSVPPKHPPLDGLLGLDILEKGALGIDLIGKTFTFWQGGKLTSSQRRFWFDYFPVVGKPLPSQGITLPPRSFFVPIRDQFVLWLAPGTTTTLEAKTVQSPLSPSGRYFSLPLRHNAERGLYSVTGRLDQLTLSLFLDLGAEGIFLPRALASKLPPLVSFSSEAVRLTGVEKAQYRYLRSFQLNGFQVDYPPVVVLEKGETTHAFLGLQPLRDCRFILDFPARRLYLTRLESASSQVTRQLAHLGLFFQPDKNTLRTLVVPSSMAEQVGVQSGDILLEVEGLSLDRILQSPVSTGYDATPIPLLRFKFQRTTPSEYYLLTWERATGSLSKTRQEKAPSSSPTKSEPIPHAANQVQ